MGFFLRSETALRQPKTRRGPWGGRLERGVILIATVAAHALVLLLLTRPVTLDLPDRSNDEDAIDVTLDRPRRPTRAATRSEAASPARHAPALVAPATVETAPAPAPALASPAAGPAPIASGPRGDLGAALRTGGLGCSGDLRKMLGPEERARCDERFGAQARNAPDLPAAIDPGKRAYYDAVVEAYHDRQRAMVPLTAPGAAGMFEPPASYNDGHGPRVGCSVKFGPNASKAPKGPPNALRAGPCFIQPPKGSLTPEADIRKPY
jgi:hypothetical protein